MNEIEFRDQDLEAVIADKTKSQRDVAEQYARCISTLRTPQPGELLPTWRYVNGLILARWSPSGLERIKKTAWKMLHRRRA